jgi:hypothetical protein
MRFNFFKMSCVGMVLLLVTIGLEAKAENIQDEGKSCKAFVQQFYKWYDLIARKESSETSSDVALKDRPSAFSPELLRLLKEDSVAQKKAKGELVGLDFDPFLATNDDPFEQYVVGGVSKKGDHFWAQIYGVHQGKKSHKPVVKPELASLNGKWQFVNFHYDTTDHAVNDNLISVLNVLKKDRQKYAK